MEGDKKKLIWSALSIFIHHSFIFPIALLVVFIVIIRRYSESNTLLTLLFVFYIFTLTVKTINIGSLNAILQTYLPGFYEDRINDYVSENALERRNDSVSHYSWHVLFFNNLYYWVKQFLVFCSFITIRKSKDSLINILPLFTFALLILGFSNILASVPSGGRYITIADMFMVATFIFIYKDMVNNKGISKYMSTLMVLLAISLVFEVRKGLDYYGIGMFGNFITAIFFDNNTPLIYMIKFL